jgi:hypothetical protein
MSDRVASAGRSKSQACRAAQSRSTPTKAMKGAPASGRGQRRREDDHRPSGGRAGAVFADDDARAVAGPRGGEQLGVAKGPRFRGRAEAVDHAAGIDEAEGVELRVVRADPRQGGVAIVRIGQRRPRNAAERGQHGAGGQEAVVLPLGAEAGEIQRMGGGGFENHPTVLDRAEQQQREQRKDRDQDDQRQLRPDADPDARARTRSNSLQTVHRRSWLVGSMGNPPRNNQESVNRTGAWRPKAADYYEPSRSPPVISP